MIYTRRSTVSSRLRQGWVGRVLVLSFLTAARAGGTTADDLCAPEADPCIVGGQVAVTDDSVLDFGARRLVIERGALVDVGTGNMTIAAGEITVEANATVQALGPTGRIDISAGTIAIVGVVSADGSSGGGNIRITATAALLNGGLISANGTGPTGVGGNVELMGGRLTVAGDVEARGSGDNLGGCVTAGADQDVELAGNVTVAGGDGGGSSWSQA
jgi:hypothetical protein